MNCWLQGHKSGITWKHAEDTIEIHKTSLLHYTSKRGPFDIENWCTKPWHRHTQVRGPPGSVQDARRREGRHSWAGRTTGSAGPTLAPNRPSFGGKNDLIYIRRFPYVSIFISGGNRPPWAIKGASLTPSHTHHSRVVVVAHCKGDACGGTTQTNWARVHWSLLLGNSDPNRHAPVVPRVKPRLKPRYSRISRQHSHEGEPRDYNTEHFIHLRVVAAEKNLLQTMFKVVKYYRVPSTQIIQVSLFSGSIKG